MIPISLSYYSLLKISNLKLQRYLEKNYETFTLAGFVDYVSETERDNTALTHVDKNQETIQFSNWKRPSR